MFPNTVTTYNANGTQTTPTIALTDSPTALAVDAAGKIYVANGNVTAYTADGAPTTPTISLGFNQATAVALH